MSYIKVKDNPNLVRDSQSKAILNINRDGLKAFNVRREEYRSMRAAIAEIDNLKNKINGIEEKLNFLVDKLIKKE